MSFPRYPEYKNSGIDWLGDVPSNWLPTRLKRAATVVMGQSPSSDDCNQDGDGSPFLQGNAEFGSQYPTAKQFCSSAKKFSVVGDLLFSVRAPVGALNLSDQSYAIGRGLCALRASKKSVAGFVWWYLPAVKSYFESISTGSTFEAVSAEQVENLPIVLPNSVTEQTQIACFLDHETAKIDSLIHEQKRLIELLKEKRQAVISHAVTKGLDPNVPMKASGVEWLGKVPVHWEVSQLKYHICTRKGVAFKADDFSEDGVPVVKASDIKSKTIRGTSVCLPERFLKLYPKAMLRTGDIVVSTVGSNPEVKASAVGQLARVPSEFSGTLLNQNTVVFDVADKRIIPDFAFGVLQTSGYRDHLDLHAHGTANQASLNVNDMLEYAFALPPIDEQVLIAGRLQAAFYQANSLHEITQQAQRVLQERRSALIAAAVTGKIDVRNWQPSADESAFDEEVRQAGLEATA
jgi:type I restriction enzyme S subunit